MNTRISLALIVKPDINESKLLDRALSSVAEYVDEICVTQAGKKPNKHVSDVIKKYGGKESFFEWVNDFSKARNFNFEQTTGDFIFWIDADDVVKGAEHLKRVVETMQENGQDTAVMNYLYDFTREGKKRICTVKHLKTRIVKRDVVEWVGEIHEDFAPKRTLSPVFVEEIEILHLTSDERAKESSERNIEIAKQYMQNHPNDPRGEWLVANALMGENRNEEAAQYYEEFIAKSNSDEEIFIAFLRMGDIKKSLTNYLQALALRPDYPDAFLKIGELYFEQRKYDLARRFLLIGLRVKTPEREIIVYNPRDYDFNPLMLLAKIYIEQKEYAKAVVCLERCVKIIPDNKQAKSSLEIINKYRTTEKKVDEIIEEGRKIKDLKKLEEFLDSVPDDIRSHPKLSVFRNIYFTKTQSTGKDIAYYCGYTEFEWHQEGKKLGGSEEAVVNLAKKWSEQGYNVTVFNNCGNKPLKFGNITYKPYWMYNPKDVYDHLIIWRHPKPVDFTHASKKIHIDVHDVLPAGEFTPDRLEKISTIFLKTHAHRILYPNVPDEKIRVIPNGFDASQFTGGVERDPYFILNTSSPDRHIDATLDIFEELIKRQPDKPWKLGWYYGWDNYLAWNSDNKELMAYYKKNSARFEKLLQAGRAEGGKMIPQDQIAKKYQQARIFLYPTQFMEIHCISAVKAQAGGCSLVTSDFAALNETVQYGTKIHTEAEKWGKESTFGDNQTEKYIQAILEAPTASQEQIDWAKETYNWDRISKAWLSEI